MMKGHLLSIALCLLLAGGASAQKNVVKGKLYSVSNMEQFLSVLGPDRTIELAADFFFLPEDMKEGLVFENTENLTIVGDGPRPVRFVTPIPDVAVMTFIKSKNITLKNIELGHAPEKATTCDGPVLSFQGGKDILIENCFLFGSGYEGINADNVNKFRCVNTTIRGCTGRIITFSESRNISFENCVFTDNVGLGEMVAFSKCKNVVLDHTEVSMNRMVYDEQQDMQSGHPVLAAYDSRNVSLNTCTIVGNSCPYLFLDKTGMKISKDCVIHHNYIHVKDHKMQK